MRQLTMTLCIGSLLIFAACGDPLTESEAKKAWPSTNSMLDSGQSNTSGNPLTVANAIGPSFTANCAQAGSLKYTIPISTLLNPDEFSFVVNFNDCKSDDIKMNGELKYALSLTTTATSMSFSWSWKGDLDYEGAVEGDCEYDMSGSVTVGQAGGASPVDVDVQYSGKMCDHDAAKLLNTP